MLNLSYLIKNNMAHQRSYQGQPPQRSYQGQSPVHRLQNIFSNFWQGINGYFNSFDPNVPPQIIQNRSSNNIMVDQSQQLPPNNSSIIEINPFAEEISRHQYENTILILSETGRLRKQCGICYEKSNQTCKLSCEHQLCKYCLDKLLQNSKKCPFCRRYIQYYWFNKQITRLIRPIEINDDQEVQQVILRRADEEQIYFACAYCQNVSPQDRLIVCASCHRNYCHPSCIPIEHRNTIRNIWRCRRCI